jgi:hypothetical protein
VAIDDIQTTRSATVDTDEPHTATQAQRITAPLGTRLTLLRDWHSEVRCLLANVEGAVEALDAASSRSERADAHYDLVAAAEALRERMEELRSGQVPVPGTSVSVPR